MEKTHWKKLTNPNYLGAYSLEQGKDLTVKIKVVKKEFVKGTDGKEQECVVCHTESNKPLILNKTNMKTITKLIGSPYIEDWSGHSIILYAENVRAFGENVDALRVRPIKPKPTNDFTAEKAKLNACKDLSELKTVYTSISKDAQTALFTLKESLKTKLS